jgi:hypothetical protein
MPEMREPESGACYRFGSCQDIEEVLNRSWANRAAHETEKPARVRRASQTDCLGERRYADLSHLLPMFPIEPAVKPGVPALTLG